MSGRRTRTSALNDRETTAPPESDFLHQEAAARVGKWSKDDRRLFRELMEDAASSLQREVLLRAVAAGRTAAEAHALGDGIRDMEDEALFAACSVDGRRDVPVTDLLRAQADPLFALELNGHRLTPKLEDDPGPAYARPDGKPRPQFRAPPALFAKDPVAESFEVSLARGKSLGRRELGQSEAPSVATSRRAMTKTETSAAPIPRDFSGLLSDAVAPFGLELREHWVDEAPTRKPGEGAQKALPVEQALEAAARALDRGWPVVVALGKKAGEQGRCVLLLQASRSSKARAFQLHDPFANETVWANEKDLTGRHELPFSGKQWRRITKVWLPVGAKGAGR